MKIALCDDEIEVLKETSNMLRNMGYRTDHYDDPKELLSHAYDIYILDIGMEAMDGIQTGKLLRQRYPKCCIVYLTNFDDYRSQAFGVHAFDYLKKPVRQKDMERVLNDAQKYLEKEKPTCSFHTKDGVLQLPVEDILYFEFSGRNVILHTKDHQYTMTQSLHVIAERMREYHFVMPHKSFCINLKNVKLLKGYDITMINQDIIPLSQKRSSEFRKELNDFLYDQIRGGNL